MQLITLLKHDAPGRSVRLQAKKTSGDSTPVYIVTECTNSVIPKTTTWASLNNAIEAFDQRVESPTPTTTPPAIDLDNPPPGLQTSNGRKARVIGKVKTRGDYPYIIGIENGKSGTESVFYANQTGNLDTVLPEVKRLTTGPVKKEGWVNVYEPSGYNGYGIINERANAIFKSKQAAEAFGADRKITATVKITWEE